MSPRCLLVVPISLCLLARNAPAYAQEAPAAVQALPPIVVTGTKPGVKRGRNETARRVSRALPKLVVYPTTPLPGAGIDPDKVPASVNVVGAEQIKQTGSLNISDAL